jgi:hypothetical protein
VLVKNMDFAEIELRVAAHLTKQQEQQFIEDLKPNYEPEDYNFWMPGFYDRTVRHGFKK